MCMKAHVYTDTFEYFEQMLAYKDVIWTIICRTISSIIIHSNVLFLLYSMCFLIFLEIPLVQSLCSPVCAVEGVQYLEQEPSIFNWDKLLLVLNKKTTLGY